MIKSIMTQLNLPASDFSAMQLRFVDAMRNDTFFYAVMVSLILISILVNGSAWWFDLPKWTQYARIVYGTLLLSYGIYLLVLLHSTKKQAVAVIRRGLLSQTMPADWETTVMNALDDALKTVRIRAYILSGLSFGFGGMAIAQSVYSLMVHKP